MKTVEYICRLCGFTTLFQTVYRLSEDAPEKAVPMVLAHQLVLQNPCPICHTQAAWDVVKKTEEPVVTLYVPTKEPDVT